MRYRNLLHLALRDHESTLRPKKTLIGKNWTFSKWAFSQMPAADEGFFLFQDVSEMKVNCPIFTGVHVAVQNF